MKTTNFTKQVSPFEARYPKMVENHNQYANKLISKVSNIQLKNKPTLESKISMSPIKRNSSVHLEDSSNVKEPKNQDLQRQLNRLIGESKPYMSVKQSSDTEQWTERILKQNQLFDKHKSCSNIPNEDIYEDDLHLKKFTQLFVLQPHLEPKMHSLQKKLKEFKYLKENSHNQCASTIAKMKCFCLDNSQSVFDFYRCTDLIMLKYMIYLLLQDMNGLKFNNDNSQDIHQIQYFEQTQNQLKAMVKEVVAIIYEIIDEIRNKSMNDKSGKAIDQLNHQIQQIQQKFNFQDYRQILKPTQHSRLQSANFDNCTTPQAQMKNINFINDRITQSLKKPRDFEFQTSPKQNQNKIIQYQIDELNIKNESLAKLNDVNNKLQQQKKQLIQQISEQTINISTLNQKLNKQIAQTEELEKIKINLQKTLKEVSSDKDQYFTKFATAEEECQQLKVLYDDLQKNNSCMHKEYSNLKQQLADQYNNEINQIKNAKDDERAQLKKQINEKNLIILTLLEDAQYFGKQVKSISGIILSMKPDQLNKELLQMQRELYLQENAINQKLNTISQFTQSVQFLNDSNCPLEAIDHQNLSLSQLSTSMMASLQQNQTGNFALYSKSNLMSNEISRKNSQYMVNQFAVQKQHGDLMQMLLMQCDVIEKFLL